MGRALKSDIWQSSRGMIPAQIVWSLGEVDESQPASTTLFWIVFGPPPTGSHAAGGHVLPAPPRDGN